MENKIYLTRLSLNIQKEKKQEFMHSVLLPTVRNIRNCYSDIRLFIKRYIEVGPVINIYYCNVGSKDASAVNDMLITGFQSYIRDNKEDLKENDIYLREKSNIAKMNGLKYKGSYINFSNEFSSMDYLKRHGEYSSEVEEAVFNDWLFENGQLLESTIELLAEYSLIEQRKFIISLFLYCSNKLNSLDLDGYLSFKSHYLGFISANKKMLAYHDLFLKQFDLEKKANEYVWRCSENLGYYIIMDNSRESLLAQWRKAIDAFVNNINQLDTLKAGFLSTIQMLRFRSVSNFHKQAFALQNLGFYRSKEFQAYRRIVNLIYMILPTLGFNTIDRLYCAVCLVKIIEGDIINGQIKV